VLVVVVVEEVEDVVVVVLVTVDVVVGGGDVVTVTVVVVVVAKKLRGILFRFGSSLSWHAACSLPKTPLQKEHNFLRYSPGPHK